MARRRTADLGDCAGYAVIVISTVVIAVVALVAVVVNTQLLVWQLTREKGGDDSPAQGDSAIGITLEPFPEDEWDDPDDKIMGFRRSQSG